MYERILHRLHSITKISNKKSLYQCPQVLYIQHNNAKVNILLCRIIKIYRGICCLALDLAPPGIPFSSQINTCHRTYNIFRNLANNKMMEDIKLFLYILPRWTPITDLFSELSHLSVFLLWKPFLLAHNKYIKPGIDRHWPKTFIWHYVKYWSHLSSETLVFTLGRTITYLSLAA